MRLLNRLFLFFWGVLILSSCSSKNKLDIDTSSINVNFEVTRFDQLFYTADTSAFPKIKQDFSYLFPKNVPDSIWIAKMKDSDSRYLFNEAQKIFPDFKEPSADLNALFKHVKYYFPKYKAPKGVTLISDVDYNNKVIYTDSLLLISLDMYLGKSHEVYQNFPEYVKKSYSKNNLKVDVASQIALNIVPRQDNRTFISSCVQKGKILYSIKSFIPSISDSLLLNYNPIKIQWAQTNTEFVWRYFIENKMLFKTDRNLYKRFLTEAPFSKFYLKIDNKTPGNIGGYIGYKIVNSYIKNTGASFTDMLQTPNEKLFKNSKFKPKN